MKISRGMVFRALAAVKAIWLGMLITEPLPLDACPMHGTHHGVAAANTAHHHLAGHGAPNKASHQCTCIGDCSAAGMVAVLADVQTVASAVVVLERTSAPLVQRVRAAHDDAFIL